MNVTPLPLQKHISLFVFIAALLLFALPCGSFAQTNVQDSEESPYVELVSNDGVKIEAEIMLVENDSVRIRRRDRQVFNFPISMLNERSRKLVEAWALDNALANSLEVRVRERSLGGREKVDSVSRTGDIKTVQLQFTINNKSTTTIDNLRIEYRIYVRREQISVPKNEFATEEVIPGKLTLNRLEGGKEAVLDANPAIKLLEEKLKGNFVPAAGNKRSSQDKIDGYWYRIYRGKNLIIEHSLPRRLMQVKEW